MATNKAATERAPDAAKITDNEAADAPVSELAANEISNYERAMADHRYERDTPASE